MRGKRWKKDVQSTKQNKLQNSSVTAISSSGYKPKEINCLLTAVSCRQSWQKNKNENFVEETMDVEMSKV